MEDPGGGRGGGRRVTAGPEDRPALLLGTWQGDARPPSEIRLTHPPGWGPDPNSLPERCGCKFHRWGGPSQPGSRMVETFLKGSSWTSLNVLPSPGPLDAEVFACAFLGRSAAGLRQVLTGGGD